MEVLLWHIGIAQKQGALIFLFGIWNRNDCSIDAIIRHILTTYGDGVLLAGEALADGVVLDDALDRQIIQTLLDRARTLSLLDLFRQYQTISEREQKKRTPGVSADDLARMFSLQPLLVMPVTILGRLRGRPYVVDGLLKLVHERAIEESVRTEAVRALQTLGEVCKLRTLASDDGVEGKMRRVAADALGRLGSVDEAAPILISMAL